MTITTLKGVDFAKVNDDRIASDTGNPVVSNPDQDTPAVATPQRIMSDMNSQKQEQASSSSSRQHDDLERLLQVLQHAAQSMASSADTAAPPSSTLPHGPTAPNALQEHQHASPPPPSSKGPSPRPANAPIVASAEPAASLMAGWVCRFKFWVGVGLTPLCGLLRLILLYCLPGLCAALLGSILCLFFIILLWNAALFAVRGVHHNVCSAGLDKVTPWLSAPGLGFGDFCNFSETTLATNHSLGQDPSGVVAMTKWDVNGTGLVVARRLNAQISVDLAQLVANTESWQDQLHVGERIHQNVLDYRNSHRAAKNQLNSLFAKHTEFIQSLMFDVKFLSHHVQAQLESHNGSWSWAGLPVACVSRMPILRRYLPLGMLEQDFKTFAKQHQPKLKELTMQAGLLLEELDTDVLCRSKLNASLLLEWKHFTKECLSVGAYFIRTPYCNNWDRRELRTILHDDIGEWLKSVKGFVAQSAAGYQDLLAHYSAVVTGIDNGSRVKGFRSDTTIAYRNALETIRSNMVVSLDTLQEGLYGYVIPPISK